MGGTFLNSPLLRRRSCAWYLLLPSYRHHLSFLPLLLFRDDDDGRLLERWKRDDVHTFYEKTRATTTTIIPRTLLSPQ
jgi:hypothetical protein